MNRLPEKSHCTGCAACYAVCVRKAITMSTDSEGFLYPVVDSGLCVKCGMCAKVCPSLSADVSRLPLAVYAAKAKNDDLRGQSSSGGVFSLLAKSTIDRGGLVFGAAFDHDDWHVFHRSADSETGLAELRGSKYVQSEMGGCFNQVDAALKSGREVLFSGTPCQIAGLGHYLEMTDAGHKDNLLLVDVACHAVPSPAAWRRYLEKRVGCAYDGRTGEVGKTRRISSRCKSSGWKDYSMSLCFANGKEYLSAFGKDPFIRGFLAELYNRPSCHNCPSKELRSGSDMTIADYWGVAGRFPEMDDDKGTSLVLVNSEKGREAFGAICDKMEYVESDYAHACETNPVIVRSTDPHRNRARFFRVLDDNDFDCTVDRMLQSSLTARLRSFIGRQLRKVMRRK